MKDLKDAVADLFPLKGAQNQPGISTGDDMIGTKINSEIIVSNDNIDDK